MKKFLISISILMFGSVGLGFVMPATTAYAAEGDECSMYGQDSDPNFLSFPTWYRGIKGKINGNGGCSLEGTSLNIVIFTIALNVIDIALRIVGIMAVGFVIWGGFRYIISQSEPERAKQALDTILKAVIGMVIAMVAAVFVNFLVSRLSS